LGIPQGLNKIHANTFNRRGNHPGLEKKPPLKKLADPANLKSDVPAIKAAAEIKQAEDLAPQKIKAIKFLATIGCGCYDKDGKVTKALLAAMDDCTEEVRLEAVRAISVAASGEYCSHCKQRSCCNETIAAQLYKMAYDLDDLGCFVEPSERVREAAIAALRICCPNAAPIEPTEIVAPPEGTTPPPIIEGTTPPRGDVPPPPPILDSARRVPPAAIDPNAFLREASLATGRDFTVPSAPANDDSPVAPAPAPNARVRASAPPRETIEARPDSAALVPEVPATPAGPTLPSSRRTARLKAAQSAPALIEPATPSSAGVFQMIDPQRNLAHIHFTNESQPMQVGSRLRVLAPASSGWQVTGELEIVESYPGSATVRGLGQLDLARLSRDTVVTR
jgi:hypothetical protein